MTSSSRAIKRARPLLGTTVAIRVEGLFEKDAHAAIDAAFAEIALVHRLMSFHEAGSDVSHLNRRAWQHAVAVHPRTLEVLREAQHLAQVSGGAFDITVGSALVARGLLPAPHAGPAPSGGNWRDIELSRDGVRFRRPLWIDLGGIAKGYAVDRAIGCLAAAGAKQASVNAGGDLRLFGPASERVGLDVWPPLPGTVALVEVKDAAIASSSGAAGARPHIDGRSRRAIGRESFVAVVAERCMIADALTKVVLAREDDSRALLARYGAMAHVYDPAQSWRHFGA